MSYNLIIFGYILIGIGVTGILYNYILYNLLLTIWVRFSGKNIKKDKSFKPDITIIISAHNEANLIEKSVESIFKSSYPLEKINVLIGSDGSNDGTYQICQMLADKYGRIKVYDFPRGGKNATLNKLTPLVENDLICFMDADIILQKDTIAKIISNYSDPEVGAVISPMIYSENPTGENAGHKGEKMYQSFESKTKYLESQVFSTVNSLGAFYSVRKELYKLLPNDKICDDYTPLLDVNIAKKRVIYDTNTYVIEFRKKSLKNEIGRRARVTSGGLESIYHARELFSFKHFRTAFFIFSHKLLRYFTPFLLLSIILGSLLNYGNGIIFDYTLYVILVFTGLALLGYIFDKVKLKVPFMQFPTYFIAMNYGLFLAFYLFFTNKSESKW
ncbi:MAG: hypothetical protein A2X64_02955 [Ignavibacteria bacterium GWF2_33_9]|nr:MAG: hypothetical protein A2X64_02955 [Ignavibacteria bacterium GWF2_33_9]